MQTTSWSALRELSKHRKQYLWCTLVCALLGFAFAFSLPTEYSAQVKIADENIDNELSFHIPDWEWKKLSHRDANLAQEDILTFPKILDSRDFQTEISAIQVPGKNMTYGDYLYQYHKRPWTQQLSNFIMKIFGDYNDSDFRYELIHEAVKYNIQPQYALATLQVTDNDPYISACMVDSVRQHLLTWILRYRNTKAEEDIRVARDVVAQNKADYDLAIRRLSEYTDSHRGLKTAESQSQVAVLRGDAKTAFDVYSIAMMEYTRAEASAHQTSTSFATLKNATVPLSPVSPSYFGYIMAFVTIGWLLLTWRILYKKISMTSLSLGGVFHYFSPWMLTLIVWIAIMIMTQMQNDVLYPVTSQFTTSLALWLPIFVISSLLTYLLLPSVPDTDRACVSDIPVNQLLFNFFWGISILITPLYLYKVLQIIMQFDLADMLYNLRLLAVHGNESYGFLNYCFVINQALFLTAVWRYPHMKLWKLLSIYAVNLMSCFAIMEKGGFFLIVLTTMFVLFERGIIKMRTIGISMLVIVILFFFINFMRSEQTTENETKEMTFIDFFAIYVLSPPVAFGRLPQALGDQFGSHTFQVIYLFLNRFGGHFEVNQKLQDFVYVPLPTNVYTIFQPFYQDFGYKGVAYFSMIYGVASGLLYRLFRNGSGFGRCMYSYFVYVLILQFYQENIFMSLVFFTQLTFFVWLMHEKRLKLRI